MKIGFTLSFLALCLSLFLWSCKGSKKTTENTTATTTSDTDNQIAKMSDGSGLLLVEMSKTACFGKCPVYTVKVFDNGRVEYHGVMHTERLGVYSKTLDEATFGQLVDSLTRTNLSQYKEIYTSGATDLPMTSITQHFRDSTKTVKGDFDRPAPVKALEKQLKMVATTGDWIQEEMQVPYSAIKNEIIVEMTPGNKAEALENTFADYELKVKSRIAPTLQLWVVTFNTEKVNPGRIAVLLKQQETVKEVDFNKQLDRRD